MTVEFRVLGRIEARVDGGLIDLGHARQRCVLATLLIEANRPVPIGQLLERVWMGRHPQRARNAVSSYISRLRQALAGTDEAIIDRVAEGYVLRVDPQAVDLHRFRQLVIRAGAATNDEHSVALFTQALDLWQGEAFATLDTPWFNTVRNGLDAERLAATLDRNDTLLRLGQHAKLLGDLYTHTVAYPLDERLAAQFMLAKYRCGRQADALNHYQQIRARLIDELGADPGSALQHLHQQILTADPAIASTVAITVEPPVPRQLPAPPSRFRGRAGELAELDAIFATASERATSQVVVCGTAGVGKSALALHWAHRMARHFDDGQIYLNLRGFDPSGTALPPDEALRTLLGSLAVPPQQVPPSLDAQAALYRSRLAGKRVLVILDNARDVEQVRPLLPGGPGCMVVITSRNQLTGLIAAGAHPLMLDLLSHNEARDLLVDRVGQHRALAEPEAIEDIVTYSTRLPLALTIIAARAVTHPDFPLEKLAAELCGIYSGLDVLADADPDIDVRAAFSCSYRALGTASAGLFRLLGLHPGPDFTTFAVASLAGAPVSSVRPMLAELARSHMITEHLPGRYTLHDLLRVYARELTLSHDSDTERHLAGHRILDHYLHTGHTADRLLNPHRDRIALPPASAGVVPEGLYDADHATAWFAAEHQVLLAAIDQAAHTGFDRHAWQLPLVIASFLGRRGHWYDWAGTQRQALDAALRSADQSAQAHAHRGLARAYVRLERYDDAAVHLGQALELFHSLGDRIDEAQTYLNMGWALERQGRHQEAIAPAQKALDLYRAANHRTGLASTLSALGWYLIHLGDYERAIAHCEQSLVHFQEIGDNHSVAATLDSLGYAHYHLGQYRQAIEYYEEALSHFTKLNDRYNEAELLLHMGEAFDAIGDRHAARRAWKRAADLLDQIGHPNAGQVRARLP